MPESPYSTLNTTQPGLTRNRVRGFTLMELLVVLSLVMVLLGLGVGIFMRLRRTYAFPAQVSLVRTIIRKARNFALTRGAGATVVVDPWRNEVRACGIRTSGYWSFDTEASDGMGTVAPGAYGYDGTLYGVTWINGAFGGAYDFPADRSAYIECQDPGAGIFDDVSGIHLSMWIKPVDLKAYMAGDGGDDGEVTPEVELAPFVLIAKMPVYCLSLIEDYSLEFGVGDVSVENWVRTRPGVIFPNRWNKIELTYDGRVENELDRVRIIANGIECYELYSFDHGEKIYFRSPEGYSELPADDLKMKMPDRIPRTEEPLTISCDTPESGSGGPGGFIGAMDEVSVSVVVCDEVVRLTEARLKGYRQEIHFDKRGRLDAAYHNEPVVIEITNDEFYRAPEPLFPEDEEESGEGAGDEDDMGIGPKIPGSGSAGTSTGVTGDAAQGLFDNGSGPRTSASAMPKSREGARTETIVVELSGNISSRKTIIQQPELDGALEGYRD